MKKILFVVSVKGYKSGGHIYSLIHISEALSKVYNVKIISVGPGYSNVLSKNRNFEAHLTIGFKNILSYKYKIMKSVCKINPDIIHFFDVSSFYIFRPILSKLNKSIVLNKCGGGNPSKVNFPDINTIVFSKENYDWFLNNGYKNKNIHLIPNRVSNVGHQIDDSGLQVNRNKFIFFRIARFSKHHKKSLIDSIKLADKLSSDGIDFKIYLIGNVQDEEIFKEIKNKSRGNKNVQLLTDIKYTENASKLLYLADAVIGTGRGVMEASSLGIPVLTIDKNEDLPVLINNENYEEAFSCNFSERNEFSDNGNNYNNILKVINNVVYYGEISEFINKKFKEDFDICNSINKYSKVYNNLSPYKGKMNISLSEIRLLLRLLKNDIFNKYD